ncbi:MAG: glutaminyl-peptide cyclotransferase [Mucilaginibacter sp.]|nr:glutaminyl-peptide cyclotransferase [Mucilaginibacter sp.]
MHYKYNLLLAAAALIICSCHNNNQDNNISISPEAGTSYKAGDKVAVKTHYSVDSKPDSLVYLVDSVKVGSLKDSAALILKTDTMPLGARIITAKVYKDGKSQEISTNIVLLAAAPPAQYTYKVIKTFPHDTSSYTEGLQYADGVLYESTGNYGHSTIRKSDLNTGRALQVTRLDSKYFGEGISVVGGKVIQMTYREKVGFVYDKNSLKLLNTFKNYVGVEGWGMCSDGKKLYFDDSTNRIWFLNKDNYHQTGFIEVYDDKQAINDVNELEYVGGKLYANVYTKDTILVINPKTGAVLQRVDMKNLWPNADRPADFDYLNNVLNGIAWDEKGKRLFVTGKKWPHVYQVEFVKK